jgi:LysW-gamma-L-lysine carboxypeptidase
LVASVIEEEATSRGIREIIKEGIQADYAIFGEPSGVENITIGYKGQLQLKIVCKTETGHASTPWLFENALEKAYELWMQIKNSYAPIEKQIALLRVTACLTQVSGGKTGSVIPFAAEMRLDIRVPPQFTSSRFLMTPKRSSNSTKPPTRRSP